MNGNQLKTIALQDPYIRRTFKGIYARNKFLQLKVPNTTSSIIVNTQNSDGPGEHWIAIFIDQKRKRIIWFDSYNKLPSYYGMQSWFRGKTIENKGREIQNIRSYFCGLYVLFFLYFINRGFTLRQILQKFSSNTYRNDRIVASFFEKNFNFNPYDRIKRKKSGRAVIKRIKENLILSTLLNYNNDDDVNGFSI